MFSVNICKDFDYICKVMIEDKEMYERASNDFTDLDTIKESFGSVRWLECSRNGERIGLSAIRAESDVVLNIHIHIQKQFRGKGTVEMGRLILDWAVKNSPSSYAKINTKVPVIYQDVIRFAHKLGFKDEGIDRESIMKNGIMIDRQNLGITFDEVLCERT